METQGCLGCHTTTGEALVGPSWKGIWESTERLGNGSTVTVNEAYVTESILNPNAKVVEGFAPGLMVSYQGILSSDDIQAIIEYIKTLK